MAFLLLGAVIFFCRGIENYYPLGGVEILSDGSIVPLPSPTASQQRILAILNIVQTLSCILFPVGGLIVSVFLFYYLKLKQPISCLQNGIMRIQNNDLDFSLPILSNDEMGQLCAAFEEMRSELLKSNRLLWQQAEERKRLNAASLTGTWGQTSITNILNNEVYLGMIRWKHEPTKRVVKDGMLTKKRVTSKDYELYEGLHEPIIDQEQWDRVKAVQSSRNHASVHKDKKLMNPFATILFCEKCGAVMKRNVPAKTQNTSPWYRCPTRGCNCRTIKCDFLEAEVVKAMSQWWGEYTIKIKEDKVAQTDSTETALSIVREQLTELQLQQDKICEYLEKGIYTIEMFTKRNDTLTREIHKVQAAENELLKKQGAQKDIHDVEKEIIPTTQHILDSYPQLSVEEKNRLWKIVMERITAYRTPGGEVSIHIYPKLPMR